MRTFLFAFMMVALASASTVYAQQPAALGVTMSDNSAGGVLVTNVIANSPAARMGLQPGDRIQAINGQTTPSYRDVMRIIGGMPANARVELTVARAPGKARWLAN